MSGVSLKISHVPQVGNLCCGGLAKYKITHRSANKALPGFLRAEFDERSFTKEETEHVGHDVVHYDHQNGQNEPDQCFEHVLEMTTI